MSPQDFAYWLQGFFELSGSESLSPRQVQVIKDHLSLVFDKQTPDRVLFEDSAIEQLQRCLELVEKGEPAIVPMVVPYPGWDHQAVTC